MRGVKVSSEDADAVRSAMERLRAEGWITTGAAEDVRMEMHIALWRDPRPADHEIRVAIAHLAALCYVREQRHLAPTATLPPEPEPPQQTSSWWGMLTTDDED